MAARAAKRLVIKAIAVANQAEAGIVIVLEHLTLPAGWQPTIFCMAIFTLFLKHPKVSWWLGMTCLTSLG